MSMTCIFPKTKFENSVTGYRISCAFTPGLGFANQFFVYVQVRVNAKNNPGTVEMGASGDPPLGTLQLTGGQGVNHSFPEIQLMSTEDVATRLQKLRILEFQYDAKVTDTEKKLPTLSITWQRKVDDGQLGTKYKFNLGGGEENVLSFSDRRSATGGNVLRFTTLANSNSQNSWFAKIFEFSKELKPFTIPFGGTPIPINKENLQCVYLDETFGEMLLWPLPALRRYTDSGARSEVVQMDIPSYTQQVLLEHANKKYEPQHLSDIVQTATFFLKDQNERNLQIP